MNNPKHQENNNSELSNPVRGARFRSMRPKLSLASELLLALQDITVIQEAKQDAGKLTKDTTLFDYYSYVSGKVNTLLKVYGDQSIEETFSNINHLIDTHSKSQGNYEFTVAILKIFQTDILEKITDLIYVTIRLCVTDTKDI